MIDEKNKDIKNFTSAKINMRGDVLNAVDIKSLIYAIRDRQVMLDNDLAMLYGVETRVFNQAVKRNESRFPSRFRFQLSEDEYALLRSQFVTATKRNVRFRPYAFTEQGIAMLSAVLRSDTAVEISIRIMDAFVEMNRFFSGNAVMFEHINTIELKQLEYQKSTEEKFDQIFGYIEQRVESSQMIFFDGQVYDAFSFLSKIVRKAERSLILIDNYVDLGTLNIFAKKRDGVSVSIYSSKGGDKLTDADVRIFNEQYPSLKIHHSQAFHDRFFILDKKNVYHIGASIKDAGKKTFAISKIRDETLVSAVLNRIDRN